MGSIMNRVIKSRPRDVSRGRDQNPQKMETNGGLGIGTSKENIELAESTYEKREELYIKYARSLIVRKLLKFIETPMPCESLTELAVAFSNYFIKWTLC